ncbi:MAG TPA: cytochrome P450 [Acidimicrobiia bacterium]|nr:cytochrome P450 [Acidimicrobiia bacterium]
MSETGMSDSPEMPEGQFDFDPAGPQSIYDLMREHTPVLRTEQGGTIIARHEDVEFALRNADVFSSDMEAVSIGNVRPLIPLQVNPPEHVKYRRLLDPLFAPKQVALLEADVRKLSNQLIDDFIHAGECEFNSAFAIPLPCTVFLRLLGLPLEDLDLFLEMKDNIIRPNGEAAQIPEAEFTRIQAETGQRIYAYFNKVLDEREQQPQDDMLTGFLEAEVDGHRLTREDILDICYLFLLAGLDTVTASVGCMVSYLAQHPEQRQRLVDDPSRIPGAVEELLRWETPVPGVPRVVAQEVELSGERLQPGQKVTVLLGSANIDERGFPEPAEIDFARPANRHLAFGGGVHRCLGSHLARLELRVALEQLHERIPDYAIKPGEEPKYTAGIRAVEYLPLAFTPPT